MRNSIFLLALILIAYAIPSFANDKTASNQNVSRDSQILKNDKTLPICSDNKVNYQRDIFQLLYKDKRYREAYDQLNFYAEQCKKHLKPQTALWIKNDLALAIQKAGDPQRCLNILNTIENDPAYSSSTESFKKAAKFNKNQCTLDLALSTKSLPSAAKLDNPKGDKEYAWLLNIPEEKRDELFSKLINQAVPTRINYISWLIDH